MAGTILIVEDSDDDYFAIMRVFEKAGLRNPVRRCDCGDQALDCLHSGVKQKPGLILLDLNMPGTDGRDVLRAIKATPDWREIPIIVLTSSFSGEDVRRCYDFGADSYLVKPVDKEGLLKSIERLKERWQGVFELDFGKD